MHNVQHFIVHIVAKKSVYKCWYFEISHDILLFIHDILYYYKYQIE